jgi:4'-phosphopantetheinyl transferase
MSAGERRRAAAFSDPQLAALYRTARSGLRLVLAAYLQADPRWLTFRSTANGKPALAGCAARQRLHFNLSHSGQRIAVAVSRGGIVGVDIERVRSVAKAPLLAARFFGEEERALLAAVDPLTYPCAFFRLWTLKEAFVKASGLGLARRLDSFALDWRGERPQIVRDNQPATNDWTMQSFIPEAGYRGAVVVGRGNARIAHFDLADAQRVRRICRWECCSLMFPGAGTTHQSV